MSSNISLAPSTDFAAPKSSKAKKRDANRLTLRLADAPLRLWESDLSSSNFFSTIAFFIYEKF